MPGKIKTLLAPGGQLNFYDHPGTTPWNVLERRLRKLEGLEFKGVYPGLAQAWIDFKFQGHEFSIDTQWGDYWFFAEDPTCPTDILSKVADQCEEDDSE